MPHSPAMGHTELDRDAAHAFFGDPPTGPVVMLNLLRFNEVADYTGHPELAPSEPISGRKAYGVYSERTIPLLEAAGAAVELLAEASVSLIGPADEHWDTALLVRYPSAQAFRDMTSSPEYLAGYGHRAAALADSRLIPLVPRS